MSGKEKQDNKTTTTMREDFLESLSISESEVKREIPVMTRLGKDRFGRRLPRGCRQRGFWNCA